MVDPKEQPEEKHDQEVIDKLHNRARSSAVELQKVAVAFSTGVLGLFFFTLTIKTEPSLTTWQTGVVLIGVIAMFVAATCGVFSWWADAKWNTSLAKAMSEKDKSEKAGFYKQHRKWKDNDHFAGIVCLSAFAIGITCSTVYMIFRILKI